MRIPTATYNCYVPTNNIKFGFNDKLIIIVFLPTIKTIQSTVKYIIATDIL